MAVDLLEDELHLLLDLNLLRVVVDEPAEVRDWLGILPLLLDVPHE